MCWQSSPAIYKILASGQLSESALIVSLPGNRVTCIWWVFLFLLRATLLAQLALLKASQRERSVFAILVSYNQNSRVPLAGVVVRINLLASCGRACWYAHIMPTSNVLEALKRMRWYRCLQGQCKLCRRNVECLAAVAHKDFISKVHFGRSTRYLQIDGLHREKQRDEYFVAYVPSLPCSKKDILSR